MITSYAFSESKRFTPYYIRLSELIYGTNFQSPGNYEILDHLIGFAQTSPRRDISDGLDIGCGCGGNSFYLSSKFNCKVLGIDINDVFVDLVKQRIRESGDHNIDIVQRSILDFAEEDRFDIAVCRDVFMYISDKLTALRNIYQALRKNGSFVFTDYCRSENEISDGFQDYIAKGGFSLISIDDYARLFEAAGFGRVVVGDVTDRYISYAERALSTGNTGSGAWREFDPEDIAYIRQRTANKITYCKEGSMCWVGIYAEK